MIAFGASWYGLMCGTCDMDFIAGSEYLDLKAVIIGFILIAIYFILRVCWPTKEEVEEEYEHLKNVTVVNTAFCQSKCNEAFLTFTWCFANFLFWGGLCSLFSWVLFLILQSYDKCCNE